MGSRPSLVEPVVFPPGFQGFHTCGAASDGTRGTPSDSQGVPESTIYKPLILLLSFALEPVEPLVLAAAARARPRAAAKSVIAASAENFMANVIDSSPPDFGDALGF